MTPLGPKSHSANAESVARAQTEIQLTSYQPQQSVDDQFSTDDDELSVVESDLVPPADLLMPSTLEEFEELALGSNPALSQAQTELRALYGKHLQAGLPPNPEIGVLGVDINDVGTDGRYGIYLGREIVRGQKLERSQSVVCAEIQVSRQRVESIRQRLLTDVRTRFYDVLIAQQKFELTERLVTTAGDAVETSRRLLEAQEVARSSYIQAELEYQNALVIQRRANNELLAARRQLSALIGESDLPTDRIDGTVDELIDQIDFEQAYDDLLASSPELARLMQDVSRARRQLERECVEAVPNLTWQLSLQYGVTAESMVPEFQVGMPLPIYNRNQGAIRQARRNVTAAQFRADRKAIELRERLTAAFEEFQRAKLQADAFADPIIPQAREALELISRGYRQGEVDFISLLTAQRTYFFAELDYLLNLKIMWQQYNLINGLLLDDSQTEGAE